MQFSEAPSKQ